MGSLRIAENERLLTFEGGLLLAAHGFRASLAGRWILG